MIDIDYYYRFIDQRRLEKRGNKQTKKKYQSIVGTFVAVELYRDYSLHFVLKKVKFSFKYCHWQVTRETTSEYETCPAKMPTRFSNYQGLRLAEIKSAL